MPGLYETGMTLKLAEVGDTIFNVQSDKVPFSKMLKRGPKPKQVLSQWPVEVYEDRPFEGAMDGSDMDSFEHTNRDTIEAYAMWMRTKGWMVSRMANLTRTAGVPGKEEAKQAMEDGKILARMMERQMLSNDDMRAETVALPYRSRGAFSWMSTSAQSVKPVPAAFRPTSGCVHTGTLAALTPAVFEGMIAAAAEQRHGAVDLNGQVGLKLKTTMSGWAQKHIEDINTAQALTRYNLDAEDKKLIRVVNFFEFDGGSVKTFPNYNLLHTEATGLSTDYTSRSGIFIDLNMWQLCYWDPPASRLEPPKSGGPRGYHDCLYLLKCLNPAGQCMVYTSLDS